MRERVEAECMKCSVTSPQPLHREELQPQTNDMAFLTLSEMSLCSFSLMCREKNVSEGLKGGGEERKRSCLRVCECSVYSRYPLADCSDTDQNLIF